MPLSDEQNEAIAGIQDQTQQFAPEGPGDPKRSPVTAKVVPIGTGPAPHRETSDQGLSPESIANLTKNITEGTSGQIQDVPHDLLFQPKAGQDNYLLRAQDQGFMKSLALTAGNLIPNVAADILDMVGQAANIPATIAGGSDYDSGGFGKMATAIRDPFGEVYREHPDKTFDMGDSAWWLQNIAGFVEGAASFVLPGEGEAALFSKLGKLATEATSTGRLGLEATQVLGHTISAFSMGYLMSASSGKRVYDEAYKTNYDRFIRQGYDPQAADDEAKHMAADGAAKTVQIGTLLNGVLNLTALAPLFKGSPQEGIENLFRKGEGAIQSGESLEGWKGRLGKLNPDEATAPYRHGLTGHGFQAFQVGLQGVNTEYAEKTGIEQGTGKQAKQLDMISDYFDKVTDQEGALNMLSGLLGGLTQNILMDRVPLHRIVRIDPTTNKPIYKNGEESGKYETQLVSARTRDMMNNRQYFSSMRDAVVQDINRMKELGDQFNGAKTPMDKERYRQQLMSVGDLNAVSLGMTENWKEVYRKLGEKNPFLKKDVDVAIEQLTGLQKVYDKVSDRMAPYQGEPNMDKLQDHMFHQEANHFLFGHAIGREERSIATDEPQMEPKERLEQDQHMAIYLNKHLGDSIRKDVAVLESGDDSKVATVASRYGVNAYDKPSLQEGAKKLAKRLRRTLEDVDMAVDTAQSVQAITERTEPPNFDVDIMNRRVALEKAREEHAQQAHSLSELRSGEGRQRFLDSLRKSDEKWKKALDAKAARDVENLFVKQQDKEAAAKLDKDKIAEEYNTAYDAHVANDVKMDALYKDWNRLRDEQDELHTKGFFKNFKDKARVRAALNRNNAERSRIELESEGHKANMDRLKSLHQNAEITEDTARNAHREDVENDLHSQQNITEPTKVEPTPDEGIAAEEHDIWKRVGTPAEYMYADLANTLPTDIQLALDNLELLMPDEGFQRDLVHKALQPFVQDQRISQDTVHDITEKMKDWWEENRRSMDAMADEPVPMPSTIPQEDDPIISQDNQVSSIPEPDSPIISYNSALNVDNMEVSQIFREVGAKALTSMKVNSRSIEYMRVEKAGTSGTVDTATGKVPVQIKYLSFLPMYNKLDPSFNKNILKPGFVSEGDQIHFEVDKDWNGQVTLDKADAPDEYGMPTGRGDSFADYSTPDGKVIMSKQAPDLEPAFANVPIKIVHDKSGETIGYLPRVDWVTAKRPDTLNYRNIEDTITDEDGNLMGGNVEAQREKLLAVRATIAQAHNAGEKEPIRTHVSSTGPGHLFLSTEVNVNTEKSKLVPKLAKNLLPDPKLKLAILDKGTMMIGHGTPHTGPANFDAKSLSKKYQTEGQQWNNTPMVLLPMPNGKVTESPLFTRKLEKRPADIHTVAKAVESYLVQGTAAETAEHTNIVNKLQQHTGYDISTAAGLRSFINQYYTYTQKFSEVHTRANAEVSGPKSPRFMLDIPDLQPGEQKAAVKVGTSFSGSSPIYALTRDGKINPEFDQALRDGLQTHYKNVVYTSQDIKGINDNRPLTAVTIQRDGRIRTDKYDSYNEYAKSFSSTVVYGEHRSDDGTYLYGANPITEFDFNAAVHQKLDTSASLEEPSHTADHDDEFIRQMMNSAVTSEDLPAKRPEQPESTDKTYTKEQIVATEKGAPLSEEGIQQNINKLYDEAAANPEQGYHLDIQGAGKTRIRLADGTSMTHFKLAQMLNSREIPYNIRLSDSMRSVLENTPRRFLNGMMFQDDSIYSPLKIDDKILGEQLDNTFVPVRDEVGNHTGGYFSPERQGAVVDSIVKAISIQLDKAGEAPRVGDMMNTVKTRVFDNLRKIYERVGNGETVKGFDLTAEQGKQMAKEYSMVLNSFEPSAGALSFWGEAMKKLDQLGIRVKENKATREDEVPTITNGNEETMKGSDGKGRDWFDDHFEQNPMDSASSRVKMFVASTTDSTVGTEQPPVRVKLAIDNPGVRQRIVEGKVLFTAITVEEARKLGLNGVGTEGFNTIDGKPFRITNVGVIQEGDVHAPKIAYEENKEVNKGDIKLQFTPWKPKPEQLIPNRNYLGLPKLADYEQLYEDAMATLGDTPRNLKAYIARLKEEGLNGRPNLFALAANLEKAPPQVQNEFVSVMTLHYQPFTMVLADPKKDAQGNPYYALRTINANRASQLNTLVDHWQQSQKFSPILEKTSTGTTIVSTKVAQALKADLQRVNDLFNKGDGTAPNEAAALLKKTLVQNGIILPDKAIEAFMAGTKRWTNKTSLAGDFRRQFAVTEKGEAQGLVSAMILRLAGEGKSEDMLDSGEDKSYQLNNPLYMEGTAMKVLAKVAAAFTPSLYSNTHRSSEGKSIYDWGLPHKLSNDFNKLKSNEQWRQQFQDSDFAKRSWLLEHISNNPELRDRAGLSYLDGIRAARGKQDSGTTRPSMSDREQLFTAVGLFQNGADSKYAHYLSLTHSDRSTTPVFMNMPRIPVVTTMKMEYDKLTDTQRPKFAIHDEVVKRMYDVFLSEYDRINKAAQVIESAGGYNDARYEKGSQNFYMLPQFNHDRMLEMVKAGKITEGEFNSIWMMGDKKLNVLEGRGFKEAVDKVLRLHVEELMLNTAREWKAKDVITDDSVPFDKRYTNKLLSHVGIYSNKDGTYRTRDNQEVPQSYVTRLSAQLAARDYAVNAYLFNTSLSQVLFGDPAQNFKGSVEKTMVEYGKRLTQFISPRKEGNWDVPSYTTVTVKDFTTKADYLGELSKAYTDINATDAQELTTVQEKLNVAKAYGRISDTLHQEMTQIIKDAKGGYYEFTKPEHLAFVMQPEKPLYSGSRAPFQGAILNDYVKSSAYALYPPLLAGKELDKLRVAMEKGDVARVNFESAKKVGIPMAALQLFDNQGRINEDVFESNAWTGTEKGLPVPSARQELSRDNFGLSQEVPYDETKEEIRTVSQMNKLISESIPTITTPFEYKGEKLSGTELAMRKEEIRKQIVSLNQDKLLTETGAKIDEDGNVVVQDRQKIYDALLKHAQEQGGYSPNDLAILQHTLPNTDELIIPMMFSPSASKFESLVMSMVNGITDVYMPGKSYVQASPAGHRMVKALGEMSSAEQKSIIRIGDWDGGELKTIRHGENGKVLPAQILLPFNFQLNGKPVLMENYIIDAPMSAEAKEAVQEALAKRKIVENAGFKLELWDDKDYKGTQRAKVQTSSLPEEYRNQGLGTAGYILAGEDNLKRGVTMTSTEEGISTEANRVWKKLVRLGLATEDNGDYTYGGQRTKSLDTNRIPQELLQIVGARIPNSGHNLMLPAEIVGFVPSNMGDLAIVPDAITKQMGSDFDVDKLYTYRRGYVHDKETDSFKRIPEESDDTEGKLKNDYFETHWSVLNNPEMTKKILAPLDKEDLKDEAAQIEKWESKGKPQMSFFDPVYQLRDFQSQKDAKRLVGASSLSVTFNSVIQDKGLTIGFLGLDKEGNIVKVVQPINIIDEDGTVRKLTHLSGYGQSEYRADGAKTGEMRTKNDNHVMQQAEFLDYSKNRISDKVHLTVQTYPASAALSQLQEVDGDTPGWTPSIKYNTRLLSQPIIQEYSQLMAQSQDTFSEGYDPDRKNTIIEQLAQKYITEGKIDADRLLQPKEPVSLEDLTEALKKGPAQADYHFKQLQVLELFKQLDQVGSQMMTAQNTINQDVNGAGPNLLTTMGKDYTRTLVEMPVGSEPNKLAILNGENLYTRKGGESTEQGALYDTVHRAAYGIAGEFFPYKSMKPMFDFVMEHTNRNDLSVDMQKNIFNAMKSYLFSHPKLGLWEDPIGTRAKLLYGDSLAKRVLDAKNTWGKEDLLLQRLQPDIDPDGLRPDYVKYQAAKLGDNTQDENTRHWVDLLTSDDPVKQQLGHDLVRYAYLTGGIQDAQSYIKFIPYSYLIGTDFGHQLRELSGGMDKLVMADNFRTQVFQHNPQIAKTLSPDFRETGSTFEKYPERFTLPAIDHENQGKTGPAKDLVVRALDTDGKRRLMYPEFLSHYSKEDGQWILYKKAGLLNSSDMGGGYVRIDTLGDASMDEYSFSDQGIANRSLVPGNRSMAYNNIEGAFRMLNSAITNRHGRDVVEDLAIPKKGGAKEMSELLTRIAIDQSVPEHSRVLSSWLATLHDQGKSAAEALAEISTKDVNPPLTFELVPTQQKMIEVGGSAWSAASMDSFSNKLYLGEQALTNKGDAAQLLNHELLHYHTASVAMLSEDRPYLMARYKGNLDTLRFIESTYARIIERDPEVKKIMDDLHDVRRQALAAIKEDMLKRGHSFEQEYDRVNKQGRVENDWHRRIYAASSNTEFISHVLTDVNFMQYLNGKQGETKGILGRIADVVRRLMSSVAHVLGTDVQKDSLLESAIDKSMALMLHGRAEAVPDSEQMATPNNMALQLNWSNHAIVNPTLTAMDRLAGKLQEQHSELVNSLTGRLTKKEYAEKRNQLDKIEEDIESLRKNQSFQVAAEIGNRHLDWVKDTLAQEEPTPSQIMTANRVLEVWGNLIPLVYGEGEGVEEPDPAFAQLAAKAQDMDFKLLRKSEKALVQLSDGTISMRDYSPSQLTDISKDQSLLRDVVSAAGSKVTQYIGTHLQTTARHATDDITRLVRETRAVEDALIDQVGKDGLPKFYDKFFQESKKGDAWGLVQRFSQNWYDFRKSERNKRQSALKRIDEGAGDPAQKAQMKGQTWNHYWKEIDKHAIFADTRKLFETETGELKDDAEAKKHVAELEMHTDKETAAELIKDAQERYRQYLDHKEPLFDQIDAEVEAGTKTAEQAKKEKGDFVDKWSPNAFFSNRGSKFGAYGGSDYYARMVPKKSVEGFYDDKYKAIQGDPHAAKFYGWLTGKMEELKSALPTKVNDDYLGANFFPVVKKSLLSDMLDVPEYIRTMGERTMRDLGATPFEESMNASTFRQIPIDYIDRDLEKNPINSRSKDIPRVLEAFGMMALHYKHFSDAKDSIDMGEAILQKLDQARAAGTTQMEVNGKLVSTKDGLKNTLEAVRYMKDYLVYRKARQLEGKSDLKLYSLNTVEQIKTSNRVKDLLAQREKLQEQIMNGEIDPEEGTKLIQPIDAELKKYDGLRIYGSKLGDKLITINQLKTLSFNPFSGLANMTFGVVSAGIHANGGRDYSWKDLGAALKMMMHSTAKWVTFGSTESMTAEKILAVMDRTGVIGDVIDSRYGKLDVRDRKAPWRHAINPYNWMRSGDYFMKGLTTMAMMLHDKVKVTENGEQKTISMWEAMDQDGKWNSKRFGENKEWHSEDVKEQKEWDKFRNKAVRVNMIIHGNQDKSSPKLANKYILGRLLGQFRMSWLPEGWYSRFQKEHFDIQLGREVKGRYRTIAQLGFGGYVMTTLKQLYSVIGKVDPYAGRTRLDGKALTETDRENMRRNFAELAFVSGILGMVAMTRALASDTDDDKTAARYRLLMNMLIRNKQDLEFYASPQVFDTVTRDIIPAANVLKDFGKAMTATGKLIFNDDYEFQKWLLAMTHAGIPIPQATLINKTSYMMSKDLDNSPY